MQPPKSNSAAILILRFDGKLAFSLARRHKTEFRQQGLGSWVAVQNIILGAFFIIDHELDRDSRAIWPFWMRRVAPKSDYVAWITFAHAALLLAARACYSLAPS